jgi:hypothetical protein
MGLKGGSDSWLIQYLDESGAVEALLNDRFAQIEFRGETFYIKE